MRLFHMLAVLLLLSACNEADQPLPGEITNASPVVATVNGMPIHASDIDGEIALLPDDMQQYRKDPQMLRHIMRSLTRRQAVSQKAKAMGLDLDPMVRQRINEASNQILIEAAKDWQLAHMEPLKEGELKTYYQQHFTDFTVPEQVHARHILLASKQQAEAVISKLKSNKGDFAALAASTSLDDSNKSRGGDLNWFPRGVMVAPFDQAVFSLQINSISKPVKSRFGWHVIELLGRKAASQKPFEEVKNEISSILQQQRLEQWYQQIESAATIKVIDPQYQ